MVEFFIGALVLGLIPAAIAQSKGRSFGAWYVYGVALFIVALIHSLLIKKNDDALIEEGMVKCPFCAEFIKSEARICRYCSRDFPPVAVVQPGADAQESVSTGPVCQYCKKPINPGSNNCPNCGGRL